MQCKEETAEMETQRKNVHAETLHADETPPLKDFEQKTNERIICRSRRKMTAMARLPSGNISENCVSGC